VLQESAEIGWDPQTTCYSPASSWEMLVALPLFVIGWCVYWKGLKWVVQTYSPRWARYWLPTLMVTFSAVICTSFWNGCSAVTDIAATLVAFLNFPILIAAALVLAQFGDTPVRWPAVLVWACLGWAGWFVLTLLLQRHKPEPALTVLNVSSNKSGN
jgi:hypothetical protein